MQLGLTLKTIREKNELTQEDFAKKYNVTRQTVSNWENGKSYPDLLTLVRISDDFGYSLDSMLKENPNMTETMNKKIKYGESMALLGGVSAIFLSIITLAMIVLNYGSVYVKGGFFLIVLINAEAINITIKQLKKENKKSKILFGLGCFVMALLSFGIIYYIR